MGAAVGSVDALASMRAPWRRASKGSPSIAQGLKKVATGLDEPSAPQGPDMTDALLRERSRLLLDKALRGTSGRGAAGLMSGGPQRSQVRKSPGLSGGDMPRKSEIPRPLGDAPLPLPPALRMGRR